MAKEEDCTRHLQDDSHFLQTKYATGH